MIKYKFKVEIPFLDKTNNLKEVKKDAVLEVTEERLQELNAAEVGRVISAVYVEDKASKTSAKSKNKKDEVVETPKAEETAKTEEEQKTEENAETEEEPKTEENAETEEEPKTEENVEPKVEE